MDTIETNTSGNKQSRTLRDIPKARSVKEACETLGISRSTLYRLAAERRIRFIHIGSRTLVPEKELDRLASEGA